MAVYRPVSRNREPEEHIDNEETDIPDNAYDSDYDYEYTDEYDSRSTYNQSRSTTKSERFDMVWGLAAFGFLPIFVFGSIACAVIGFPFKWVLTVATVCGGLGGTYGIIAGINEGKEDKEVDSKARREIPSNKYVPPTVGISTMSEEERVLIDEYKDQLPPSLLRECRSDKEVLRLIKRTWDI